MSVDYPRNHPHERLLRAGLLIVALGLGGCGADPSAFEPPPVHPGQVVWRMVAPDQVPAACGNADARWIEGCARGAEIVTRPPARGDGELAAILQHEVAHVQGWHHPVHPDGTP